MFRNLFTLLLCTVAPCILAAPIQDTPFMQETHEGHLFSTALNSPKSIAVLNDSFYIATRAGVFYTEGLNGKVKGPLALTADRPIFKVAAYNDALWIGTVDGGFVHSNTRSTKIHGVEGPISAIAAHPKGKGVMLLGHGGMWFVDHKLEAKRYDLPGSRGVRDAVYDKKGQLWIATGMGLDLWTPKKSTLFQNTEEITTAQVTSVTLAPDGRIWASTFGGVTVYNKNQPERFFRLEDGIPSVDTRCIRSGPDGRIWVGTNLGVTRWTGKKWSLRANKRWLVDDNVLDLCFDDEGTPWILTSGGISAIPQQSMQLIDKEKHYQAVSEARHVRPPGIEEKCVLTTPGDVSTYIPTDDDNDGSYTGINVVMQCLKYAVTKDPEAKRRAMRGFNAMNFLEEVTEIPGFIARTVIPVSWGRGGHDPNRDYTPWEIAEHRVDNPRFKTVPVRWHESKDGKWLWKGDTSSDEITGHFYTYPFYYDLIAQEDPVEKARVETLVRKVMDYIIEGGYVLRGVDGTHTLWGVWSPEKLNHDPDWRAERGTNSIEILSYLKVAYHITQDEKYQQEYLKLLHEHNYLENVRQAKTYQPAWRTHIDDSLLTQSWPALFKYETDPELLALYRESLEHWYQGIRYESNPFYNFTYALATGEDPQIEDSLFFLRDCPLDLIDWTMDNSKREDIQIVRNPILEHRAMSRLVDPSERGTVRWDKNQWMIVRGTNGHWERSPTFWLLPYWMGRYYGHLAAP